MHQRAKFCQNRSIGCEDIKIFRFFDMAAAAILDFQICEILLADGVWGAQSHNCTKFRQYRSFRIGDNAIFLNFQDDRRRDLGFLNSRNFIAY